MSKAELSEYLEKISADLDRTIDFWLDHSHDEEYGGFFNCLTEDGHVFDETKYLWLQGRQVWMYCKLAGELKRLPEEKRKRLIDAAVRGGEFLMAHARNPETNKCYFSVTRTGKPVKIQRTMFSESFYALAMVGLAAVTGEERFKDAAKKMMDQIIYWVRVDPSGIGAVNLEGTPKMCSLAPPMILLNLVSEFEGVFGMEMYADDAEWAVGELFKHVQRNGTCILEHVSPDGKEILNAALGRHQNPGHAIEGAWFIMDWAKKTGHLDYIKKAIDLFLLPPFETGWDKEHGGIYAFLDVDGYQPQPLEWSMKLWWAHAETMIAFLMAFKETKEIGHWEKFKLVTDYIYEHYSDGKHGEWYGYLDRFGNKTHLHKGMAFKGCFHVPRCLLICEQILQNLLETC